MKLLAALTTTLLFSALATAADHMNLDIAKHLATLPIAQIAEMEISTYGGCGAKTCTGVAMTVPTGSRVYIETANGAACSIQKTPTLGNKSSDTYIIGVRLKLDSEQKCIATVIQKSETQKSDRVSVISFVNIKVELD